MNNLALGTLAWILYPRQVIVVRYRLCAVPAIHVERPFGLRRGFLALASECDCGEGQPSPGRHGETKQIASGVTLVHESLLGRKRTESANDSENGVNARIFTQPVL